MLTLFTLFNFSLNMLEQHRHWGLIRLHLSGGIAKDRLVYLEFHISIFWSQERSTDHKLRKTVGRE